MKITPRQREIRAKNLAWSVKRLPYAVYDMIHENGNEMPLINGCVAEMQRIFKQLLTGRQ
jgi:hypothetical protein